MRGLGCVSCPPSAIRGCLARQGGELGAVGWCWLKAYGEEWPWNAGRRVSSWPDQHLCALIRLSIVGEYVQQGGQGCSGDTARLQLWAQEGMHEDWLTSGGKPVLFCMYLQQEELAVVAVKLLGTINRWFELVRQMVLSQDRLSYQFLKN